ncbi:MAG: hypothetical protein C0404_14545 [Verrucomicrobia bacterium]|nr:hypothetical protein [Verrucomicrobiota bacterium]
MVKDDLNYVRHLLKEGVLKDPVLELGVGFGRVNEFRGRDGKYRYPPPVRSRSYDVYSKVVHELTHTAGRRMKHPARLAVAAVLTKQEY